MECCCVCVPPPDTAPVVEPVNFWANEVNIDIIGHQYAEWIAGDPESDQPPNDPRRGPTNNRRSNNSNDQNKPKDPPKPHKNLLSVGKNKKKKDGDDDDPDHDVDYRGRTNSPWSFRPNDRPDEDFLRDTMNLSPDEILKRAQQRYPNISQRKTHKEESEDSQPVAASETTTTLTTTTTSTLSTSFTTTLSRPVSIENSNSSVQKQKSSNSRSETNRVQQRQPEIPIQARTQVTTLVSQNPVQKYQFAVMDISIVLILILLLVLILKRYFQFSLNPATSL